MKSERKPLQIILIEHLFYPFLALIFLILGASYGPKVASIQTDLQPKDVSEITIAIGATILMAITLIALPYSCRRLWKSSNLYLSGFWKSASKSYAALLSAVCVIYGGLMLVSLPSLFIAAWRI